MGPFGDCFDCCFLFWTDFGAERCGSEKEGEYRRRIKFVNGTRSLPVRCCLG